MQNSWTVSPMVQKISLKAGDTYKGSLTVANPATATEDFNFEVNLSPYMAAQSKDRSMIVDWIELNTTSGTLKPNEKKKIEFTITVPENAPAGGQYATIGVASGYQNGDGSAVQNIFEMDSLIFAEIEGETVREGEIVSNTIPGFVSTGLPTTKLMFSNTGNIHETAEITLKVKNVMDGKEIALMEDGRNTYEAVIMPESTREVERELTGLPQLGIFEVTQNVNYMGKTSDLTTVMVICPIWFILLVILTILSILGMIFYGAHLRKKKRASFDHEEN